MKIHYDYCNIDIPICTLRYAKYIDTKIENITCLNCLKTAIKLNKEKSKYHLDQSLYYNEMSNIIFDYINALKGD